jgi:hypothetical protein
LVSGRLLTGKPPTVELALKISVASALTSIFAELCSRRTFGREVDGSLSGLVLCVRGCVRFGWSARMTMASLRATIGAANLAYRDRRGYADAGCRRQINSRRKTKGRRLDKSSVGWPVTGMPHLRRHRMAYCRSFGSPDYIRAEQFVDNQRNIISACIVDLVEVWVHIIYKCGDNGHISTNSYGSEHYNDADRGPGIINWPVPRQVQFLRCRFLGQPLSQFTSRVR